MLSDRPQPAELSPSPGRDGPIAVRPTEQPRVRRPEAPTPEGDPPMATVLGRIGYGKIHGLNAVPADTGSYAEAEAWCGRRPQIDQQYLPWPWVGIAAGETDVTCERCLATRPDYVSAAPLVVYGVRS